jgi:hypothetical protein
VLGRAETRDKSGYGRAQVGGVVDELERQVETVGRLADCDALVAGVAEQPPGALGKRLGAEKGERLGRAEPRAGPADQ